MDRTHKESPLDVPVIIDDVKETGEFKMSRCTYFSVASTLLSAGQSFDLREAKVPYLMVGVTGVISQPSDKSRLFDEPQKIAGFFDAVEEKPDFYVDINDIWLPNSVFVGKKPGRGNVFRIGIELFSVAFRFQNEQITEREFLDFCQKRNMPAEFSPEETEAFSIWGKQQIDDAKEHYRTRKELWLKHVNQVKAKSFEELKGGKK